MITTQTIELNDHERITLQEALSIIDDIAETANTSRENVIDYLYEVAETEIGGVREYLIKAVHDISEIK